MAQNTSRVRELTPGTISGTIPAGGRLGSTSDIGGDPNFIVILDWPSGVSRQDFQAGSIGAATVIGENAGPIASIAKILLLVKSYTQYF